MFTTSIRKALSLAAAIALVGTAASCTAAPDAPDAKGAAVVETIIPAVETTEPVADESPTPEPTPEVEPGSVEGLDAGTELTPEQCEANLDSAAFDGRSFELQDGRCILLRYGDPVPETVRADIENHAYEASDPVRAVYEMDDAERSGLEVAYLSCSAALGGGWGASGINTHGTYQEMVQALNEWVSNGTSRTWVTVSTC